jgi:3-oxoacyl-[acyl-carrier-protein] synthase-3
MSHSAASPLLGRTVTISGLGTHVPARVVTNHDLSATLDTSDEWIRQRTGIVERRIAEPGVSSSDLGVAAATAALADAGLDAERVDLVITASISPDQIMPATAARVAYGCGCVHAGAFDVSAGCAGFVYALAMAAGAVACGLHDNVLVVGAEAISRVIDWQDRSTAILFGDGAGAVVVSPVKTSGAAGGGHAAGGDHGTRGGQAAGGGKRASGTGASYAARAETRCGILGFDLGGDGSGADSLSIPAGGSRMPASQQTVEDRQHYLHMNGKEVYKFATRVVTHSAKRVLHRCGYEVDDIDLFVPHQANLRIIEGAVAKLGLPDHKVYTNLQKYGNTSSASIPLCLYEARADGRLRDGDLVLLMGFGAGLSWGACLMRWGMDGGGRCDNDDRSR